jgi:hypothetical protein
VLPKSADELFNDFFYNYDNLLCTYQIITNWY